jgi:aspartate/methionine/tyrosine aminotransferase
MHLLDNPIRSEELLEQTFDIEHRFYASSSEPLKHSELIEWARENGDEELIEQFNNHALGYAENGGSQDLRAEIANLYGAEIQAENIVVFPGAQTGMTLSAQALLHEGDHVIIVTPSYQSLEEGAKLAGAEVTRVALSPDNKWQIDIKAIEAAIKPNTKQILFNDPHNPSGSLMTLEIKKGLIALAKQYGLRIFSDEVYRLLEFDSEKRSPSFADLYDQALALGTMAKPFGAGGVCIGWVACQDLALYNKVRRAQHIYSVCFSRAGEIQAMMVLRLKEKIIGRNLEIIQENLTLLDQYFEENAELFEWVRPQASGTAFVKFNGPIDADELAAQLLETGILVFGPSIFDCEENLKQYFRIGFSRRTMPAALEAFKKFVDERKNNWLGIA